MENEGIKEVIEPNPKPVRLFFFWTGIIATIAYRIIVVLNLYSSLWVKIAWYIGTIGFVFYFGHRFMIAKKRADLVEDHNLVEAVDLAENVESEKKLALHYLIQTTLTSKSRWNSAVIFALSFLALLVGVFMDFL